MTKLVFPGVGPFVAAAAAAHKLPPDRLAAVKRLPPVSRAQSALGNLIEGPQTPGHLAGCLAEARRWRDVLFAAADGVDRAIAAVASHYDLPAD